MPKPLELKFDPVTADLAYIRWLGDRRQIESQTKDWSKPSWTARRKLANG